MESAEQLEMMIEVGNEDGIHQSMKCIRDYCIWHLIKEADFKIILTRDLMKLKLQLEKKYGSKLFSEEELQKVLKHIMRSEQLSDALNRFEQLLLLLSNRVGADSSDNIIPRVYHYMEMNYQKDLKLEGIAKSFNYNSAYLGKLFRREMGDSFNNALDSIRISNARRLLEETDYKVYQISELVGYSSIDYFYTKFKKYVGISPKQYRRNLPGSKEEEDSGNK